MIFLVEKEKNSFRIMRAYGWEERVEIPDKFQDCPVTEIGSYAFSAQIDKKELERIYRNGMLYREDGMRVSSKEDLPETEGERIQEIFLPKELKKIGRYAFYNCSSLSKIGFCQKLSDIGAGAFTGCHRIAQIEADVGEDGNSCLRELLSELPEEVCVDLWKNGEHGRFWFPEFFEEGVENTPARILENHVHGSGIRYRNCFYHKNLNIREYDKRFAYARAWEKKETVIQLALGRLFYPMELSPQAEEQYLGYLREQMTAAAILLLEQKAHGDLGQLLEKLLPDREKAEELLTEAERREDAEGISLLMDYLHRHTRRQKRRFEL